MLQTIIGGIDLKLNLPTHSDCAPMPLSPIYFCKSRVVLGRAVLRTEDYNKLIVISPKNAEADKNRAIARFNSGNVTEAIEDFKTGLKFDFQQNKINEYRELQKAINRLKNLENQI